MSTQGRVETRGYLDHTSIEDGVLVLGGWAFSEVGAIDSFKVTVGDRTYDNPRLAMNLPSEKLAECFQAEGGRPWGITPGRGLSPAALARVANCRFGVRVPLDAVDRERARASIIGLTPLVGGKEGNLMLNIIEPFLPTPPQEHIDFIGGGYHWNSVTILGHLIQWAGLRPDMDVLDAGCGVGRMAHSLVHYLKPTSHYEGFDIAAPLIGWAQENITPRFPNFNFRRVDVFNKWYNPGGTLKGKDLRFPYEDESFDFVFSTSLFTHLLAADARHYLDETYRVLRPGGCCFHTSFLLNQESEELIRTGKSLLNLVYPVDEVFTQSVEYPEDAIGFPEPLIRGWIAEQGFTVREMYMGSWCGRAERKFEQDIMILQKPDRHGLSSLPRRAG